MRGFFRLVALGLVVSSCTRDLNVPDQAPAGSVTGRVTYALPGRGERRPASEAVVSLFGTANEVKTNLAGVFVLPDVDETSGLVYFRFDADGDGVVDRQRMLELADFGAGPHRAIDVGEVVLGENAAASGRVLRGDLGGARSGHGGTTIFVPEGPFTATTNDDGSFLLPALPAGPLQFLVFRPLYVAASLGQVELRSGEEYRFRDVVLQLDSGPQAPGSVSGRLAFSPAAEGKGDSTVELSSALGGAVEDDLTFRIASVPPGLYTLTAKRSGYFDARVPNVLVVPGTEAAVGALLLTDRPSVDAGQLPAHDAGGDPPPADGGADAGTSDAGVPADAGTPCGSTAGCATSEWCDLGFCRPQCSASTPCSGGRTCDSATNTCVRPCSLGCVTGTSCHGPSGLCRPSCDLSFGCAAGFTCTAGLCLPECGPGLPACPAHRACSAGACVPDLTCDDDLDCPVTLMCGLSGSCELRPTERSDAGHFTCRLNTCHCRLGEWCSAGECLPDAVPTRRLQADGGVDVAAVIADAGPDDVLALRSKDVFWSEAPLRFGGGANRAVLSGGYVACNATRWVRSDQTRSTLRVDAGTALFFAGTSSQPVLDATVQNLALETSRPASGCQPQLFVKDALRPTVRFIEGRFPASTCGSEDQALVGFEGVESLTAESITLEASGFNPGWLRAVALESSYGTVRDARVGAQSSSLSRFSVVYAHDVSGPLRVAGTRLPDVTATDSVIGIWVTSTNPSPRPVIIEDSVLRWPTGPTPGTGFIGISVYRHLDATVRGNVIEGAGHPGPHHTSAIAVSFDESSGLIEGNRITPPVANSTALVDLTGIYVRRPAGATRVAGNLVSDGNATRYFDAISFDLANTGGPLTVERNLVYSVAGLRATGLGVYLAGPSSALHILDNDISVSGRGGCGGGLTAALNLHSTSALIERNRLFATNAEGVAAVRSFAGTNNELYGNHLSVGANSCNTNGPYVRGLYADEAGPMYLGGNTIEAEGDEQQPGEGEAIFCSSGSTVIFADSNIIGGGRGAVHRMLTQAGTPQCFQAENFHANYFWYRRPTMGASGGEQAFSVVDAGVGVVDGRGNVIAGNVSPFDPVQPLRPDGGAYRDFRLAAGSQCIDTGRVPLRQVDGTPVTVDLVSLPRDAGAGPDIGCCERR